MVIIWQHSARMAAWLRPKSSSPHPSSLRSVHRMVETPAGFIAKFLELNPRNITFHAETVKETAARRALMQAIRKGGATAGIAINPETPLSDIGDVLGEADLLLVMS